MVSSLALWQHESTTEERVVYGTMLFTTGKMGRGNNQHLPQRVTLSSAFVFLQVDDEVHVKTCTIGSNTQKQPATKSRDFWKS
jgi:hypothetical protein